MAEDEIKKEAAVAPPGPPNVERDATLVTITGDPKAGPMAEIGVSGLKAFSGYINEEYLHELQGQKAIKAYNTMGHDPIVAAVLQAITLILRAVDWRIEPADDGSDVQNDHSAQAEKEAEFAQQLLDDMSHTWEDTVGEICSMLQYGWSYLEIVLKTRNGPDQDDGARRSKYDDGRIGIRKLPLRSQDSLYRWQLQTDGGVDGMWQQSPQGGPQLFIPIQRALLFRTTSKKNSPEGVSILRASYRPWYVKRGIEDHEAIGIERELAGLPVVKIPKKYLAPNAAPADIAFMNKMTALARDVKMNSQAGVVLPSETFVNPDGTWSSVPMVSLELLSSGSSKRGIDTDPVVKRYNRLIAMAALADFLTLGDEKGSFALSQNKSELFLRACKAYLDQIGSVINRFLFPRMFSYNGIAHELLPTAKPGRLSPVNLAELGNYIAQLASAGAPLFPNQDLSDHLADVAGLPEPPQDIGLLAEPGSVPRMGQINPDTGEPMTLDEHAEFQQAQYGDQSFEDQAITPAAAQGAGAAKRRFFPVGGARKRAPLPFSKRTTTKFNQAHDQHGRFAAATGADSDHGVVPPKMADDEWHRILAEAKERNDTTEAHVNDVLGSKNNMAVYTHPDRPQRRVVVSRSLDARYGMRVTDFDEKGPIGHREYSTGDRRGLHSEISQALAGGMKRTVLKYDESLHPRDEHGRWTFGNGTNGMATALYQQTLEPNVKPEDIYNRVDPDAQRAATELEADMAKRVPSDQPVEHGGFMRPDGSYTPERQALHEKLLDHVFTPERIDAATPVEGEKPTMTMLGGRGGSGKSFLTDPSKGGPVDPNRTIVLNSDDFKTPLAKASGLDERYAALYHEESDHVLKMASARAKALGVNVAFDATMKSESTAAARMLEYQNAGYVINGHYVHTAPQLAAQRSIGRFYKGGKANGRYVPPAVILGNVNNEKNFDKLSPNFRSWSIWDNNGSKPALVAHSPTFKPSFR